MKKVHISLVGGQPIPVFIGIENDSEAKDIVLICSDQSLNEANRLKNQLFSRNVTIEICSPVNLDDIEILANRLKDQYSGFDVCMNLSSGTKLWTLTFFRTFSTNKHVDFIYVDQNNVITHILTKETEEYNIGIEKRIELYGSPLASFRPIEEYTNEDFSVLEKVEKLRKFNVKTFTELTAKYSTDDIMNSVIIPDTANGSYINYNYDEKWAFVSIRKGYSRLEFELESEHVFDILFHTGWFELKVAKEISKIPNMQSVWLNCEFSYAEGKPKNEIDVIACYQNRLIFVECKTMIENTTDIDKFRSALRNFSGTSSKGLFVTNDKPSYHKQTTYLHAMEKCKDNDILTFNFAYYEENKAKIQSLKEIINTNISTQNKR